jgi:hypothetical protein
VNTLALGALACVAFFEPIFRPAYELRANLGSFRKFVVRAISRSLEAIRNT